MDNRSLSILAVALLLILGAVFSVSFESIDDIQKRNSIENKDFAELVTNYKNAAKAVVNVGERCNGLVGIAQQSCFERNEYFKKVKLVGEARNELINFAGNKDNLKGLGIIQ